MKDAIDRAYDEFTRGFQKVGPVAEHRHRQFREAVGKAVAEASEEAVRKALENWQQGDGIRVHVPAALDKYVSVSIMPAPDGGLTVAEALRARWVKVVTLNLGEVFGHIVLDPDAFELWLERAQADE